jgi:hypothetical protein
MGPPGSGSSILYQVSVPVTPIDRGSVTKPEIEPGCSVVLLRMDHDL